MAPLTPTLDRIPAQTPVHRWAVRVATAIAFALTWIFRWLTIDFANDHFVHLSRARQILLVSFRSAISSIPACRSIYYASAAALTVSGQNLLGEAVLTVTLIRARGCADLLPRGAQLTIADAGHCGHGGRRGDVSAPLQLSEGLSLPARPRLPLALCHAPQRPSRWLRWPA
jgi:hypothetical protein